MPRSELLDATFEFHDETDRAILVSEDAKRTRIWLPKSVIEFEVSQDMRTVEVTMPLWLAREKGISGA